MKQYDEKRAARVEAYLKFYAEYASSKDANLAPAGKAKAKAARPPAVPITTKTK